MCCVMPPASPATTLALRMRSSREVLPWSTWPMTTTTGARGTSSSSRIDVIVNKALLDRDDDLVLHLAAKLHGDQRGGIVIDHIGHGRHHAELDELLDDLDAPFFFMRQASSPTLISSGMD